jgi:GTP-binding protein HflX
LPQPTSYSTAARTQRALVVHPFEANSQSQRSGHALLEEATGLAEAIHLDVVQALLFTLKKATPRTLIGPGQAAQCRELAAEHDIDVIIVNAQLSPTQQRNLETAIKCKVIDRTALILEIFGERAQTNEGRLQVELAALNYQKSRLVRSWTHLERQRGGAGFMGGPGETQIETDRRLIAERIQVIKKQLEKVVKTRELHRKTRRETPLPVVALVGYTNAGKSTLFNRLTNAKVMAEDMLFATLDPTIRALTLPSGQKALLSDTVGFISDLPHELVAAFRATLEEVLEADILLHIRDISHADTQAQAEDVHQVLTDLLQEEPDESRPFLEVWNKIDAIDAANMPEASGTPAPILTSAHTGEGCDALLNTIDHALAERCFVQRQYRLKASDGRAIAWLHAHGNVLEMTQKDGVLIVQARLRPEDANRFEKQMLGTET